MSAAIRPIPMVHETFDVFKIINGALLGNLNEHIGSCTSIDDAVRVGTIRTPHKQHFVIRHADLRTGDATLRFYAIRQGKPVRRYFEHQTKLVRDNYAEHLFDLALDGEILGDAA